MLPSTAPNNYTSSRQLVDGKDMNSITQQLNSITVGIVAHAGGGQANAVQLNAATNVVATVANANDSVKLPIGFPGLKVLIINQDADAVGVYGYNSTDTINGGATVNQAQGTKTYICIAAGTWVSY